MANLSYQNAVWYVLIGEYEATMDILEDAYCNNYLDTEFPYRYEFRNLYDNPRYIALVKKMGLQP